MFQKKQRPSQEIPTSSLPDVIFLLLFFFMVTTVIKRDSGIPIVTPAAYTTKKIDARRHLAYIWADDKGKVSVDDAVIPLGKLSTVSNIFREKLSNNNRLIVSMKVDKRANMGLITDLQEQLRDANAIRINYATRTKSGKN